MNDRHHETTKIANSLENDIVELEASFAAADSLNLQALTPKALEEKTNQRRKFAEHKPNHDDLDERYTRIAAIEGFLRCLALADPLGEKLYWEHRLEELNKSVADDESVHNEGGA
jgi:hypothetical protein